MCAMSYAYCRTNSEAACDRTIEFASVLNTVMMARAAIHRGSAHRESAEASWAASHCLVPRASLRSRERSDP